MDFLIDPEDITTLGKCTVYFPCPTFCKIKPLYGIPW